MSSQHKRISPKSLDTTTRRHIANELWTALRLREWVHYMTDTGEGGGKARTVGTSQGPQNVRDRTEPRMVLNGRGLTAYVGIDPSMGVLRGFALYLSGEAFADAVSRLQWLELDEAFATALEELTVTPWWRRRLGSGAVRYDRRPDMPKAVTEALEELLPFCEVVEVADAVAWRLHERSARGISTGVLAS